MSDVVNIIFRVNGDAVSVGVKPHETLLEAIRERLSLTGAKESCGLGACGACTVLMNGIPVRSCLVLAVEAEDTDITTIEGLKVDGKLHPLQESFMAKGAVQCGFCTSGMILTAKALLDRREKPSRKEIVRTISSNACRCTGYRKIIDAVEDAAKAKSP